MKTIRGNVYDYPQYYDLVFGSDWKAEHDFLIACFDKHVPGRVKHVFEPACGTGRLMYRLQKSGYQVSGLDLNPKAVDYCNARLEKHGCPPTAFVADMTDFRLPRRACAAFNTINSFRHLPSERHARLHLECMARALRKGGVYVLGFHLTPTNCEPSEEEYWSARRGHLTVNTSMWLLERNLRRRQERFAMNFDVYTPTNNFRLADEFAFRTYTAKQFDRLLAGVPELELIETYDFSYRIDCPVTVGGDTEDVLFVLQRR